MGQWAINQTLEISLLKMRNSAVNNTKFCKTFCSSLCNLEENLGIYKCKICGILVHSALNLSKFCATRPFLTSDCYLFFSKFHSVCSLISAFPNSCMFCTFCTKQSLKLSCSAFVCGENVQYFSFQSLISVSSSPPPSSSSSSLS